MEECFKPTFLHNRCKDCSRKDTDTCYLRYNPEFVLDYWIKLYYYLLKGQRIYAFKGKRPCVPLKLYLDN